MSRKILAVDDEIDVLLILKTALQAEGFDVQTASCGVDALSTAKEFDPDLILLDVMMPGMSGFEVLRALKDEEKTSTTPVIMLTGVSERGKIQEALSSGTTYYIVKPFEFDDLLDKVNRALNE